jgi:hypothetical protein
MSTAIPSVLLFFIPDPNLRNIIGPIVAQIEDPTRPQGGKWKVESGWTMDDRADNAIRIVSSAMKAVVDAGMDSLSSDFRLCSRSRAGGSLVDRSIDRRIGRSVGRSVGRCGAPGMMVVAD